MILAQYYVDNETALVSDFAEYYHIYDWRSLPLKTAAQLAAGLRPYSRSCMYAAGVKADLTDSLLAYIHDDLQALIYQHAGKHAKKPEFISNRIIHGEKKPGDDLVKFDTGKEFDEAWKELTQNG